MPFINFVLNDLVHIKTTAIKFEDKIDKFHEGHGTETMRPLSMRSPQSPDEQSPKSPPRTCPEEGCLNRDGVTGRTLERSFCNLSVFCKCAATDHKRVMSREIVLETYGTVIASTHIN